MPVILPALTVCDVCRLLDNCCELKPCWYCKLCDSWICQPDANAWARRIRAAIKRKLEPSYTGLSNYEEVAVPNYKELLAEPASEQKQME